MLEFREINIDDRDWINKLLKKSDFMGCEYSFANNMAWRRMNDSTISRLNDFYIVKSEDKNYVYFTFPAGNGDYQDLFDKLLKYSEYKNKKIKKLKENDTLIICGDFGFIWDGSRHENSVLNKIGNMPFNVAFIDGCHENFELLSEYEVIDWNGGKAQLISGNLVHLMRGQIYTIEGKKILAFGGGHSQDYDYRKMHNWWIQEQPTHEEIIESINNLSMYDNDIDFIITHEPPASLKDCLGVDVLQRLEIHAFFEDIIKACHFEKWFFGKCHVDKYIPMKFYAVFEEVLPLYEENAI